MTNKGLNLNKIILIFSILTILVLVWGCGGKSYSDAEYIKVAEEYVSNGGIYPANLKYYKKESKIEETDKFKRKFISMIVKTDYFRDIVFLVVSPRNERLEVTSASSYKVNEWFGNTWDDVIKKRLIEGIARSGGWNMEFKEYEKVVAAEEARMKENEEKNRQLTEELKQIKEKEKKRIIEAEVASKAEIEATNKSYQQKLAIQQQKSAQTNNNNQSTSNNTFKKVEGRITGNDVNVRKGPSVDYQSLGVFFKGDIVRVVDSNRNSINETWYKIEYDNPKAGLIVGWVRSDFVKTN